MAFYVCIWLVNSPSLECCLELTIPHGLYIPCLQSRKSMAWFQMRSSSLVQGYLVIKYKHMYNSHLNVQRNIGLHSVRMHR